MNKKEFVLKDITIRRMPGLRHGLRPMSNLCRGINIVYGPNASGKSSTARAIRYLVASEAFKGLEAEARFESGENQFDVSAYAGEVTSRKNGLPLTEKLVSVGDGASRYMLAVHELLLEKETNLAAKIARDSAGGYDLKAAAENLNYDGQISSKNISEYKEWTQAKKTVDDLTRKQESLKRDQDRLRVQEEKKEEAKRSRSLLEFYTRAKDLKGKEKKFERAKSDHERYDKVLEVLRDEDFERLEQEIKSREELKRRIADTREKLDSNRKAIENMDIGASGIEQNALNRLEALEIDLKEQDRHLREKKAGLDAARESAAQALKTLGDDVEQEAWVNFTHIHASELDQFVMRANEVLAREAALKKEVILLESQVHDADRVEDSQRIREGIKCLQLWLGESEQASSPTRWPLLAVTILAIATAVATYLFGAFGMLGLIAVAVAAGWGLFAKGSKPDQASRHTRQQDYQSTGLGEPAAWNHQEVSKRLISLSEELMQAIHISRLQDRLERGQRELSEHEKKVAALEDERRALLSEWKAAPPFADFEQGNYNGLHWFIKNVEEWRTHYNNQRGLQAEINALRSDFESGLEDFNKLCQELGYARVSHVSDVTARCKTIRDENHEFRRLAQEIQVLEKTLSDADKQLTEVERAIGSVLNRLDKSEDDLREIEHLTKQLEDFRTSEDQLKWAKRDRDAALAKLKDHHLFERHGDEVLHTSEENIELAMQTYAERAKKLPDYESEITRIRTLVDESMRGHELSDAIARRDLALENLKRRFEINLRSLTGDVITKKLQAVTRERNQPRVLSRANKILANITRGRYSLQVNTHESDPVFRAFDTVGERSVELEELSSGTRVQVLLAVRLAFVETEEKEFALPLLADELLANSDDERARAIIESLIEISKSGRQVFYFTAQADEVRKWQTYLAEHEGCEHQIIELDEGRTPMPTFASDIELYEGVLANVPSPHGVDHDKYGELIKVKPYDLFDLSGGLDLWYLIDDVDVLYDCMSRGIRHWGALDAFYKADGTIRGIDDAKMEEWRKLVQLLEKYRDFIMQGHPQPIDRDVLIASGAVSETYIERVDEKLKSLDGNPEALIAALRKGEVARFRNENIDSLQSYLIDEEYLDEREPMSDREIHIKTEALITRLELDPEMARAFLRRFERSTITA